MPAAGLKPSDFRSDTVTRPSAEMRRAALEAQVGDDVLDGDPSVARLEQRAADWLGKSGALFVPSGTMANQIAVGAWCRSGQEVVLERWAHMLSYEAGALGALHGVQALALEGRNGALSAAALKAAIRPRYVHCPETALVCVEQTHMAAGGRVLPLEGLSELAAVAREAGIAVHMDGARLANAVVASGVPAERWAREADSVSVCLSKGLGAPVGSIVAGDETFLERARVWRKRLGGWMRQAGLIAAPALCALEQNCERLSEDHALARELAQVLSDLPGVAAPAAAEIETNIVNVQVEDERFDAAGLVRALEQKGVRVMAFGPRTLRFMTHLDVGRADLEHLAQALRDILR